MTTARWTNDPSVQVVAGGQVDWTHNPDRCEIDYIHIDKAGDRVSLKASAGGYERGISLRWDLPSKFLLEKYAELKGIAGSDLEIADQLTSHFARLHRELVAEKLALIGLQETSLNRRTTRILSLNGIETLGQLATLKRRELLGISGLGRNSAEAIRTVLREFGLFNSEVFEG